MNKFLTLKDPSTGRDILVNVDHISKIARDTVSPDESVAVRMDGEDITFATSMKSVKSQLEDHTFEQCANQLYHIWKILRARLH